MDEKISVMTPASALTGAELVPLVQGGANVRTTTAALVNGGVAGYFNWGGIAPTVTPTIGNPFTIDSSTGMGWVWSGTVWVNIF